MVFPVVAGFYLDRFRCLLCFRHQIISLRSMPCPFWRKRGQRVAADNQPTNQRQNHEHKQTKSKRAKSKNSLLRLDAGFAGSSRSAIRRAIDEARSAAEQSGSTQAMPPRFTTKGRSVPARPMPSPGPSSSILKNRASRISYRRGCSFITTNAPWNTRSPPTAARRFVMA